MPPRGVRNSRALWDNAAQRSQDRRNNHFCEWLRCHVLPWLRAILYELQPIRYSVLRTNVSHWVRGCRQASGDFVSTGREWIPYLIRSSITAVSRMTLEQWKIVGFLVLYYLFLRWIHRTLEAGPLVLIVTTLVIIFTVGLSDESDRDGLSAYSVFNKGFQKLLGSVDADALLQQHLGGGWMPMMMQHHGLMDDELDEDAPPLRRRPPPPRNNNPIEHEPQQEVAPEALPPNRARRTGKKARRDRAALDQRREIRAQREAALAMGFGNGNDDEAAIARLINDDVAANLQ